MQDCYIILGYGVTGQSVLKFLLDKYSKNNNSNYDLLIFIYDNSDLSSKFKLKNNNQKLIKFYNNFNYIKQELNSLYQKKQIDFVNIVASPGFSPSVINNILDNILDNINLGYKIISDIQLFIDNIDLNNIEFTQTSPSYRGLTAVTNLDPVVKPRDDGWLGKFCNNKVFCITGTNGKSTVCKLLYELLHDNNIALGGNYGEPALNFLLAEHEYDAYVLELSSYQLELSNYIPCLAAVCLNISPDHIEWHGSYNNYIKSKLKIYENSKYDILNLDDGVLLELYCENILNNKKLNKDNFIIGFSCSDICTKDKDKDKDEINFNIENNKKYNLFNIYIKNNFIYINNSKLLDIKSLPEVLQSPHNLSNLLAVLCLLSANYFNNIIDNKNIFDKLNNYLSNCLKNIKNFKSLPHRCELIANYKNIEIYNDSKATNIDAVVTAVNYLSNSNNISNIYNNKIWLILGGIYKEDLGDKNTQEIFLNNLNKIKDINKLAGIIIIGKDLDNNNINLGTNLYNLIQKYINLHINNHNNNNSDNSNNIILQKISDENKILLLDNVLSYVFSLANDGDKILFSPGGSSFDFFVNYKQRGDFFCERINNYINNNEKQ